MDENRGQHPIAVSASRPGVEIGVRERPGIENLIMNNDALGWIGHERGGADAVRVTWATPRRSGEIGR
jgi:hypothetical protein